ncbi:MAG: sulfite exporter TauE/SafE family protein [Alphaproteobacteria bacterium]|nr:sulfite exporter TauE/SafE family protein [Alphaproteobacteria bacterium]MCB9695741.1 sulfite exporter TauE/SafE family protein [Alphaproteobacteria bacterium]
MQLAILVVAGAASGVVTGLTGGNGFSVVMAGLLLAGFDVHAAIGLCLGTQVFSMAAALWPQARADGLPWALVPLVCLPAIPGSLAGAALALRLPSEVLQAIVAAGVLLIGVSLLRAREREERAEPRETSRARLVGVGAIGAASGLLAGLFGGGGNIVVANALYAFVGLPFRRAVALSLCLGIVSAGSGVLPYLQAGRLDPTLAPWLVLPALVVAPVVSHLATRVPVAVVRRLQGGFLVVVALVLVTRLLTRG